MSDVRVDGEVITALLMVIADIYKTYQAEKRIDRLKLGEAKELADKIWPELQAAHEENREL